MSHIANHRLDANQTLINAYDIDLNRFRVDAEISATIGDLEVAINADEDSILIYGQDDSLTNRPIRIDPNGNLQVDILSISDGTDNLQIEPDGSLNVNIISSTSGLIKTSINEYNTISSLASGSETIITSYTAPIGKDSYLIRVEGSGENIARYRVFLNANIIANKHTYFGSELNVDFNFSNNDIEIPGLKINPNDTVTIKVMHSRPGTADFSGRIQVLEVG